MKEELEKPMPDSRIPTPPPGIKYHHTPNVDIVTWSNEDVPLDKLLIIASFAGWFLWTGAIVYATSLLFKPSLEAEPLTRNISLTYISIIGWIGVVVIPIIFLRLTWTVTIEISNSDIFLSYLGVFSPKKQRFKKDTVCKLAFKKHTTTSTKPSLMIRLRRDRSFVPKDMILAPWMQRKQAYQLFLLLKHILEKRNWDIEYQLQYRPK